MFDQKMITIELESLSSTGDVEPDHKQSYRQLFLFLSNYSSGTIVFIDASYNGSSRMKNFNGIYEALYKQKSLGDLHIEVMDDNSMY